MGGMSVFQWTVVFTVSLVLSWWISTAISQGMKLLRRAIDAYEARTEELREFHRHQAAEMSFARAERLARSSS